jgi:hypothetical protein
MTSTHLQYAKLQQNCIFEISNSIVAISCLLTRCPRRRYLGSRVNRELHVPPTSTIPSLAQVMHPPQALLLVEFGAQLHI